MPSLVKKKIYLGPIGSVILAFIGHKQTDRQVKLIYIDRSAELLLGLYFSLVYIFPLQSESSKGS